MGRSIAKRKKLLCPLLSRNSHNTTHLTTPHTHNNKALHICWDNLNAPKQAEVMGKTTTGTTSTPRKPVELRYEDLVANKDLSAEIEEVSASG